MLVDWPNSITTGGWTASMMGMMTLVRVLPEDKYNEIMTMIKEGRKEKPKSPHDHHKHGE
jgi:hypothetical protein